MLSPPSLTGREKRKRSSSVMSLLPVIAGIRFSLICLSVSSRFSMKIGVVRERKVTLFWSSKIHFGVKFLRVSTTSLRSDCIHFVYGFWIFYKQTLILLPTRGHDVHQLFQHFLWWIDSGLVSSVRFLQWCYISSVSNWMQVRAFSIVREPLLGLWDCLLHYHRQRTTSEWCLIFESRQSAVG